ncbi:MAG: hypothetical protein HY321_21880 [Armatimonadetes bacterium]|nr:hypothetical protein [Armatimonadota bacterium]
MITSKLPGLGLLPLSLMAAAGVATCAVGAAPDATPGAPGPGPWLNVQDLGASGSEFETTATTTAGSKEITVADVGDFRVGQGVTVSKCFVSYPNAILRFVMRGNPTEPLGDAAELRGYDGRPGSWVVYIVEVDGTDPLTFRWSDDLTVTWKGEKIPITYDWQPLSGRQEIRFSRKVDWRPGHLICFHARDQLATTIEKIEGNVLTLADAANRTVQEAVVRHEDSAALQAAINRAVQEKRNVYFPPGRYRLSRRLVVENAAAITLQGANGVDTTLDISECSEPSIKGQGACVNLVGGTEVTLRDFRFVGHTGLGEGPGWRSHRSPGGGGAVWPVALKICRAVAIRNTERVLVENCHASKMNCEAFYCQGNSRSGPDEPKVYTKSVTYLRCSATNCDGNAFNNNDLAENTSVLYCRIVDVGGCSWEGASRFVRFIGNYVRNAGPVAMGNIGTRAEHLEQLGSGQHIVADNVFESRCFYAGRAGRPMITAAAAVQVIITNNLFVNFNSTGVSLRNITSDRLLPAEIATIRGNIFDMTCQDPEPIPRTAIDVSIPGVIVSDNQIYVRGEPDPTVTAILLKEPAMNLNIHDNLVRSCGAGLVTARAQADITKVIDPFTFLLTGRGVPFERRQSHRYRGFHVAWLSGSKPNTLSTLESFDPETLQFKLREPHEMKEGDRLEVFPPSANWLIHDNTITDCLQPVALDSYGSPTSTFSNNVITRTQAKGVKEAVAVHGAFRVTGNHIHGFDEPGSVALSLYPDAIGRMCPSVYQGNVVDACAVGVSESVKGLWKAARAADNTFVGCGSAPGER